MTPADDNPVAAKFLQNVFTHGITALVAVLMIIIPDKCNKDHNNDKVLCKMTTFRTDIIGEKIAYIPIETRTQVKKKWTCVSEWADNHSIKNSESTYIKSEILKNIEDGP